MSIGDCAAVWQAANLKDRARAIDEHHSQCGCEVHSLRNPDSVPVASDEMIARILTSPAGYNLLDGEILTARLVAAYSSGISVIRQGASDDEIALTVRQLTEGGAEPNALFGAAILPAGEIRNIGGDVRWFCIYDTEAEEKEHHADIVGTFPIGVSKSRTKKEQSDRRKSLKKVLEAHLCEAPTLCELINAFRERCAGT